MSDLAAQIEPHIPALRRYAWALLRDDHAADDLVQDCLERAVGRWHLRRRDGSLRAWLFAILHNQFISGQRHRKRRGISVALEDLAAEPVAAADPEQALTFRDLLAGLDDLPEEQRAVVLLVGVEDLSYDEAARALGVPIGTVMSRLSRGRERLRRHMAGERPAGLRRVK
jgi:RNA polymerase sigma-70 factor (ECF subfamily)